MMCIVKMSKKIYYWCHCLMVPWSFQTPAETSLSIWIISQVQKKKKRPETNSQSPRKIGIIPKGNFNLPSKDFQEDEL